MSDERYNLSTGVEPFMQTTRESNGYATSYAQIRVHHGTHADFPPHVGLDGDPKWNLSGRARICADPSAVEEYRPVMFFDVGSTELPDETIDEILENDVEVVGTSHNKVGDFDAHQQLLSNDIVIVENVVNLDDPPSPVGYAHCFALLIDGCTDGAPVVIGFDPAIGTKHDM